MISVFQIYFDARSQKELDPAFYSYSNEIKDDYFENSVIKKVYEMNPRFKEGIKYLGVTSWKQYHNTHLKGHEIISHIQKDIDSGKEKDVYIYYAQQVKISLHADNILHGIIHDKNIWDCHFHRNPQLRMDNELLNNAKILPFDFLNGPWQYCHKNYWIAKKEVFDEYCKTVLLPAIEFYELPEIKMQMPLWYGHPHEKRNVNSSCFTLEGLFGSFLAHSNYSIEYICKKRYGGRFKKIQIDKYEPENKLAEV